MQKESRIAQPGKNQQQRQQNQKPFRIDGGGLAVEQWHGGNSRAFSGFLKNTWR
jgi:hypothetical protein